ncbi:PLP-dependent aminotransferase family protein [Paenibacillus sp. H1-7]|uniref:aminotransferase-like domain-containing protein n=1 Tax=Paenibacillus sp. H1-7 TaxID=2282849 RepID=UPI001EF8A765|nr:PLP-dependent aminotransferase family protein [Paenibacillus sp. H1-7]ULL16248.1 PLP-dependent aminotransferase family protein [Paenibacillus sp. H1-7]
MENWQPDRASHIPLHLQIKAYIINKIANGEWPVGTKIPPQRKLAEAFGVNRSTIVAAMDELTADGFIEGSSGAGTIVVNHTWSVMASTPPPDWTSYVKSGAHSANLPTIQQINEAEFRPGIIRLGTGELAKELLPSHRMQEVLQSISLQAVPLGYEEPKGNYALRQHISRHVKSLGITASPSSILIVSGALQALQLISLGLLHRGSTVLLEKPSYLYSVPVFPSAAMNMEGIPLDNEGIDVSLLPSCKKRHNGALLYTIPCYHNPTGVMMTQQRREQLMDVCNKEGLPVIEDDVYRDLWLDNPPPAPLKAMDANGIVLYLGSFSKTVSPGLRIGWVIGPEPVIQRLADIKMQTDYGSSSISQWAAAEWLSTGLYEEHLQTVRRQLAVRRDACLTALEKHFGSLGTWNMPSGGFYIWLCLPRPLHMGKLFELALKDGILLNPGYLYDKDNSRHLRISYAYASLTDMEKGLERLSRIVRDLMNLNGDGGCKLASEV